MGVMAPWESMGPMLLQSSSWLHCHMVSIWSCEWLPKMASKKVHPAVSWCIYGLIPWRSCWMGRKLQRSILHSNKNVEILHYFWSPSRQGARFSGVSRQSLTSLKEKRSHDWKKRNKPIGFKDFRHQLSIKKVLAPWFFRISSSTFVWSWAFNTNRKHQDNNAGLVSSIKASRQRHIMSFNFWHGMLHLGRASALKKSGDHHLGCIKD